VSRPLRHWPVDKRIFHDRDLTRSLDWRVKVGVVFGSVRFCKEWSGRRKSVGAAIEENESEKNSGEDQRLYSMKERFLLLAVSTGINDYMERVY